MPTVNIHMRLHCTLVRMCDVYLFRMFRMCTFKSQLVGLESENPTIEVHARQCILHFEITINLFMRTRPNH